MQKNTGTLQLQSTHFGVSTKGNISHYLSGERSRDSELQYNSSGSPFPNSVPLLLQTHTFQASASHPPHIPAITKAVTLPIYLIMIPHFCLSPTTLGPIQVCSMRC